MQAPGSDKLELYRQKRSAGRTPEPFPGGSDRPGLFVVHMHSATRLHWDLRLSMGGVLRSWAIPKGPSPDPAEKRFAAETEDHPIGYADFEGVIPPGNYGAGPMIVWDRGQWIAREDPDEGYRKGKLLFELRGYKLRGVWTLVRLKSKPKDWLCIKERDGFARPEPSGYSHESVLSGLTIEDLKEGKTRAAELEGAVAAAGAPRRRVDPASVGLMLGTAREEAFDGKGWLFELKYDGYRGIAGCRGGRPFLYYRGGSDAIDVYPELGAALRALPYESTVLDGEVVILGEDGRPHFQWLQRRGTLQRGADRASAAVQYPATYFAFDLLGLGDLDLRPLPLTARKELLRRLLPRAGPIRFVEHIEEHGRAFFDEVRRMGLEGVLAKKADTPYRAGRSPHWLKVRADRVDDFVVVGFSHPEGSRTGLGSLHLGIHDGGKLVYAGRAGTGFTEKQLEEVRQLLESVLRKTPPCEGPVPKGKGHSWVDPRLVCEVRYKECTEEGLLRQPVFLRFRTDKTPEECVRSEPDEPPPEPTPSEETRTVVITRPEKVFWPAEGYTKGDLVAYYRAVSPWLLPFLAERPLVLTRYPDGIEGKSFFQKDAPSFAPGWLRTERMWSEGSEREIDYFVCDDEPSLSFVINMGAIPLHVWSSRVATLGQPDWTILDLDPKGAPFADVVKIARAVKELCDALELPCFLKTSGSSGLHVLVPLGRQLTFEEARVLAELLARVVNERLPDISTLIRNPAARGGKVYIDTLQNGHGKLLVAPFSVRPLPGAPVSTPLLWREANDKLDIRAFTIETVPPRLKKQREDPLRPVLELKPDLGRALSRLSDMMGAPTRQTGRKR